MFVCGGDFYLENFVEKKHNREFFIFKDKKIMISLTSNESRQFYEKSAVLMGGVRRSK